MTDFRGNADRHTATSEYNRLEFIFTQLMNGKATAALVEVKSVIAGNPPMVNVQPAVAQLDGAGKAVPHGIINRIPVVRMQGGAFALIIDPQVGDIGLAVFCSSDISVVKKTKAAGNPGSRRKFDWADGVYVGRLFGVTATSSVKIDGDGVTITSAGAVTVKTGGSDITLNAAGGKVVVPGELDVTSLKVNGNPYDQHKHLGVTTGGGTSGIVAP